MSRWLLLRSLLWGLLLLLSCVCLRQLILLLGQKVLRLLLL